VSGIHIEITDDKKAKEKFTIDMENVLKYSKFLHLKVTNEDNTCPKKTRILRQTNFFENFKKNNLLESVEIDFSRNQKVSGEILL